MKLVNNTANIEVKQADDGTLSFSAIGSDVGVRNRNDLILMPNALKFDRDRYPLLYSHGESATDVIGDSHTEYDAVNNQYITDFVIYDTNPNIVKSVQNGAFQSVSIAYYMTDYDFMADGSIMVNEAIFKEVSLVSVPADPNANFITNEVSEQLAKERKEFEDAKKAKELEAYEIENKIKEKKEILKRYE